MNPTVLDQKDSLRRAMRQRLAGLTVQDRTEGSVRICQRLRASLEWQEVQSLLAFLPLPSEPDVLPALRERMRSGRAVFVPRWNAIHTFYEAALMPSDGGTGIGPFGIPEPPSLEAVLPLERLDLILVPGLAFDRTGRRLGRGKGHFDRLLAGAQNARRWGVAFDMQIVAAVPTELHDVNVDLLVTPASWQPVVPA